MKKGTTIILRIAGGLLAALTGFFASTIIVTVPLAVMIITGILSVVCFALSFILSKKRISKIIGPIITTVMTIFLTVCILALYVCNPYAGSTIMSISATGYTQDAQKIISKSDAEADIKQAYAYIKKVHPLFLNNTPKETEDAYNKALENIPEEGISCAEIRRRIEKICSSLGDAHTNTYANVEEERYPCDYGEFVYGKGLEITEINGEPLMTIFASHLDLFSYESESWAQEKFYGYITTRTGLEYLGFSTEVTFTYGSGNERIERTYTDSDFVTYENATGSTTTSRTKNS